MNLSPWLLIYLLVVMESCIEKWKKNLLNISYRCLRCCLRHWCKKSGPSFKKKFFSYIHCWLFSDIFNQFFVMTWHKTCWYILKEYVIKGLSWISIRIRIRISYTNSRLFKTSTNSSDIFIIFWAHWLILHWIHWLTVYISIIAWIRQHECQRNWRSYHWSNLKCSYPNWNVGRLFR